MKIVEFYGRNNTKLEAYVKLVGTVAVVVNSAEAFTDLLNQGIRGNTEKRLTPEDGIEFMEQLSHEFSGSYFRASEVLDVKV